MDALTNMDLQELYKSIAVVIVFTLGLWEVLRKLASMLSTIYKHRKGIEDEKQKLQEDIEAINKTDDQQTKLIEALIHTTQVLESATTVQMRHSIVRIAEDSLKKGTIGAYELKSLEEMFECYGDPNGLRGNSYAHDLIKKVRKLPIDYSNGNPDVKED